MKRRSELKPASELLRNAIGHPELLRRVDAARLLKKWEEIVGKQLAAKSAPDRFEDGTLWVAVTSSAWVQELGMRKEHILTRLNELARGNELFKEIRFGVRPVASKRVEEKTRPTPHEPEEVDLEFHNPEIEAIAKPVLGKMKAASRKRSGLD